MVFSVFFHLPELPDECSLFYDGEQAFNNVLGQLNQTSRFLKNCGNKFNIFFSSSNVSKFLILANNFFGTENERIRNGLMYQTLKVNYKDLDSGYKFIDFECQYYKWSIDGNIIIAHPIISECAELSSNVDQKVQLVICYSASDFYNTDGHSIQLVKDSLHLTNRPNILSLTICQEAAQIINGCQLHLSLSFDLSSNPKYVDTGHRWGIEKIFRNTDENTLWYFDFFHRDNRVHFEVFDRNGLHLGEADADGNLLPGTKDNNKRLKKHLR